LEPSSSLICLGVITAAHGVRGQVKLKSFTAHPKDIASYGELHDAQGRAYCLTVITCNNDTVIASIKGIEDREAAEKLRNIELFIERSKLPEPSGNEYYYNDLVGLAVVTESGAAYGQVTGIHNFGAGDIVDIRHISGKEECMPFNKATFPVIDMKNKTLVISPPEII
jgi:16S rRNA processing protein RimM